MKPAAKESSADGTRRVSRADGLGVLQGAKTWLLADEDGQIELTHSVSAGLDYAAVGPEHCYLRDIGRAEYDYATDGEALAAFRILAETEGIIPALESAHAVAHAIKVVPTMKPEQIVVITFPEGATRMSHRRQNFC